MLALPDRDERLRLLVQIDSPKHSEMRVRAAS